MPTLSAVIAAYSQQSTGSGFEGVLIAFVAIFTLIAVTSLSIHLTNQGE